MEMIMGWKQSPGQSDRQGMRKEEGKEVEQDHPGRELSLHHPLQMVSMKCPREMMNVQDTNPSIHQVHDSSQFVIKNN